MTDEPQNRVRCPACGGQSRGACPLCRGKGTIAVRPLPKPGQAISDGAPDDALRIAFESGFASGWYHGRTNNGNNAEACCRQAFADWPLREVLEPRSGYPAVDSSWRTLVGALADFRRTGQRATAVVEAERDLLLAIGLQIFKLGGSSR